MFKEERQSNLPGPEERRRILERAGTVLAQARSLLRILDAMEHASMAVERLEPPGLLPESFAAIDILMRGTRKEERLFPENQMEPARKLPRMMADLSPVKGRETLVAALNAHTANDERPAKRV